MPTLTFASLARGLVIVAGLAACAGMAAEPRDIVFTAAVDGTEQRYVELLPPGFVEGAPRDAVIVLHGHGSDRWQFIRDGRDECRGIRDVAAAHGLILAAPDYRAKTSWMGPRAEADVVQIIAELRRRHAVDRVFVVGGSMGGTSAVIFATLHPRLVAGVCSLNGTANMVEFAGFPDAIAVSYGGTKAEVPGEYERRSPELHADRLTMPVAFTTGGRDEIVPPPSTLRLAAKLEAAGRPVSSIHRADGGHATNYDDTVAALEFILRKAAH
jgi:dipeptidyl aminopeptidase/acylaminoacyl peptidase